MLLAHTGPAWPGYVLVSSPHGSRLNLMPVEQKVGLLTAVPCMPFPKEWHYIGHVAIMITAVAGPLAGQPTVETFAA